MGQGQGSEMTHPPQGSKANTLEWAVACELALPDPQSPGTSVSRGGLRESCRNSAGTQV